MALAGAAMTPATGAAASTDRASFKPHFARLAVRAAIGYDGGMTGMVAIRRCPPHGGRRLQPQA